MKTNLFFTNLSEDVIFALIDYFAHSITSINSYEELTEEEKNIFSKDIWNKITIKQ